MNHDTPEHAEAEERLWEVILEYVDGVAIDQYCDENKLDVESRVKLFLDVLKAMAEAHANLIVHRDIKPSNVFVRNDGQVKLLDFGIAKLLSQDGDTAPTVLTIEGSGALTPRFAAPEQVTGGTMTTAAGLVFFGDDAESLEAVDALTGKPLWHFNTGQSIAASPMSYAINSKQYVALAAGSDIFSFALP